jgi:hypothetical protein
MNPGMTRAAAVSTSLGRDGHGSLLTVAKLTLAKTSCAKRSGTHQVAATALGDERKRRRRQATGEGGGGWRETERRRGRRRGRRRDGEGEKEKEKARRRERERHLGSSPRLRLKFHVMARLSKDYVSSRHISNITQFGAQVIGV